MIQLRFLMRCEALKNSSLGNCFQMQQPQRAGLLPQIMDIAEFGNTQDGRAVIQIKSERIIHFAAAKRCKVTAKCFETGGSCGVLNICRANV